MKRRMLPGQRRESSLEAASIDALYGLEPVFEPHRPEAGDPGGAATDGVNAEESTPVVQAQCPYCGELIAAVLDLSAGSACYIEDCHICCQPIEFDLVVGPRGTLDSLELRRSD